MVTDIHAEEESMKIIADNGDTDVRDTDRQYGHKQTGNLATSRQVIRSQADR